ncbi:MAG TPA: 2OG-Fe(II) oxygenase [Pyrinomonadaceae bacterium]|jgi:Rps23 Pro-64 3,4-dihydroxylase Tpa1-like proline 4-hydroxylase
MREALKEIVQLGKRRIRFTREAGGIIISVSLFQPRSCRAIIESVRGHAGWDSAKVSRRGPDGQLRSVVDPSHRTASVLYAQHLGAVRRKFDVKMNEILKPLVQHLWGQNLTDHEGTQFVHYAPGGHYIIHSDVGPRTLNRYYSVVCYLNDDFEGGATRFPSLDYSATPRCGKAILFPSTYLHGGEPVKSGEKHILVSWITGPERQR